MNLRIAGISLDCADPQSLADFYARLLDGQLAWSNQGSAGVRLSGEAVLVFQRVADFTPPAWPGSSIVHLDLAGDGQLDDLEARALAAGARLADVQFDSRWRIFLDPAGHPFCITTITP